MLKGIALPWLFPALGLLITLVFIFYSYKQNAAYGEALLELLKEIVSTSTSKTTTSASSIAQQ